MATSALDKLHLAVEETERLGEQFLEVRSELVATDKLRQEAREALTALRKVPVTQDVLITRPGGVTMQVAVVRAVETLQRDMTNYEGKLEKLRKEEKRLVGLLSDKGAGSQRVGPGMLQAMLNLTDTESKVG